MFFDNFFRINEVVYSDGEKEGVELKDLRINVFNIDWDKFFIKPFEENGVKSSDTIHVSFNIKNLDS